MSDNNQPQVTTPESQEDHQSMGRSESGEKSETRGRPFKPSRNELLVRDLIEVPQKNKNTVEGITPLAVDSEEESERRYEEGLREAKREIRKDIEETRRKTAAVRRRTEQLQLMFGTNPEYPFYPGNLTGLPFPYERVLSVKETRVKTVVEEIVNEAIEGAEREKRDREVQIEYNWDLKDREWWSASGGREYGEKYRRESDEGGREETDEPPKPGKNFYAEMVKALEDEMSREKLNERELRGSRSPDDTYPDGGETYMSTPMSEMRGGETTEGNPVDTTFDLISPLVPRVDTWLGQEEVSTVPEDSLEAENLKDLAGPTKEDTEDARGSKLEANKSEPRMSARRLLEVAGQAGGMNDASETMTISPLAPRVDTWWGQEHVSIVPVSENQINQSIRGNMGGVITSDRMEEAWRTRGLPAQKCKPTLFPRENWWGSDEASIVPVCENTTNDLSEGSRVSGQLEEVQETVENWEDLSELREDDPPDGMPGETMEMDQNEHISPHVPRVDTWRGLHEVDIVLTDTEETQTHVVMEGQQDGERAERPALMNPQRKTTGDDGKSGRTHSQTSKTNATPACVTQKRASNVSTQMKGKIKSKARQARHFYRLRHKKRKKAKTHSRSPTVKQKSNQKVKIISTPTSRDIFSEFAMANADAPSPNNTATKDMINALDELVRAVDKDEVEEQMEMMDHDNSKEHVNDETVEPEVPEGSQKVEKGEKEKPKKSKKAKKEETKLVCEEEGCDYSVGYKTKMAAHMKTKHGVGKEQKRGRPKSKETTPASSSGEPTPVGNKTITLSSSNGSSPELVEIVKVPGTGKKRAREEEDDDITTIAASKKIRKKLAEVRRTSAKPKALKILSPEGKVALQTKIKELEQALSVKSQEADDQRARAKGLEGRVDMLRAENEEWVKSGYLSLEGKYDGNRSLEGKYDGSTKKVMQDAEKRIKSLQDEVERFKELSKAQYEGMEEVNKYFKAATDEVAHLKARTECRNFRAGRCYKRDCKYAHVLPETKQTMINMNEEVQKKGGQASQQGGGENHQEPSAKPLRPNHCIHYEQGFCKFGPKCKKIHDKDSYNTRPRSRSAGSAQQGFQRPPKMNKPGTLGVVPESPSLPMMENPEMSADVQRAEIERMDQAAKKFGEQEKLVYQQLRELRVKAMLRPDGWNSLHRAFNTK